MSEAGIRKQVAWLQASAGVMEGKFDYDAPDPEAQLSWDLWKKQAELAQAGLPFLEDGYPFDQMNGMQSQAPMFMINFHKVDEESDYVAYVSRLRKFDPAFDQLLTRGRPSSPNNIRPPTFAYAAVIDQSHKVLTGAPFDAANDTTLCATDPATAKPMVTAVRY